MYIPILGAHRLKLKSFNIEKADIPTKLSSVR